MEGFVTEPAIEEQDHLNQASKIKTFTDPLENFDLKVSDLSLADSFLDFDSIKEFFEYNSQNQDSISFEKIEIGVSEKSVKMAEEEKINGSGCVVKADGLECDKEKNLNICIEEEMGKVSLSRAKGEIVSDERGGGDVALVVGLGFDAVDGNGVKSEVVSDKKESESDTESEHESSTSPSSSSSSSISSDDDDEDEEVEEEEEGNEEEKEEVKMEVNKEVEVAGELEEGEIVGVDGEMDGGFEDNGVEENNEEGVVYGIDAEVEFDDAVDEDENGCGAMEGPIRSKNELQVLPPVPRVNVALEPHHQMLPVGVVVSVLGVQVIVEGVEKHNPLNDGSILWITESRSPLGLIDEIFGPVKNPYYVVRYNSESEIPAGIHVGTLISFVQEFANHVLNDKNLYKKGYDASGENDEELSDDAEFSDDEKEAEYKRKLKMEKRGMSEQRPGSGKNNRKKGKNRDATHKNDRHSVPQMAGVVQLLPNQNQPHGHPVPGSLDHGNCSSSSAIVQGFMGETGSFPQFPPMAQTPGFTSLNRVWTNGMPSQSVPNATLPNGFPTNSMPWPAQNYQQHPCQPMINNPLLLQQFNPNQLSLPDVVLPGGQSNFFGRPAYAPWPGIVGQNSLNQMIGMGFPGQPAHPSLNAGEPGFVGQNGLNQMIGMGMPGQPAHPSVNSAGQAILPDELHGEQNNFQAAARGKIEAPKQFNMGASASRGRKPYHRGGGRFGGGRGRHQPK